MRRNTQGRSLTVMSNLLKDAQLSASAHIKSPMTFDRSDSKESLISDIKTESGAGPSPIVAPGFGYSSEIAMPRIDLEHDADHKLIKDSSESTPGYQMIRSFHETSSSSESGFPLTEETSPERSLASSLTNSPIAIARSASSYRKSRFFNELAITPKQAMDMIENDSEEEEPKREEENKNCGEEESKREDLGIDEEVKSEDLDSEPQKEKTPPAKQEKPIQIMTLSLPTFKPQAADKNRVVQITKQLAKLKVQIDKKKSIVELYEFIMVKGKIMVNQELKQRSNFFV